MARGNLNLIVIIILAVSVYLIVTKKNKHLMKTMFPYNVKKTDRSTVVDGVPLPTKESTERPIFYGRDSCPYTVKMKQELESNNAMKHFEWVDVETQAGQEKFKEVGGQGVPYFTYNGRVAVGYMPTSKLFKMLDL